MSRTAERLARKLLEYGIHPDAPAPGSPDDPWRQMTGPIPPFDVKARPGEEDVPVDDLPPEDEPPVAPVKIRKPKYADRHQWRPPATESLIQELGGHWCQTCMTPVGGQWDDVCRGYVCPHCQQPLVYPKSSSLRSRECCQPEPPCPVHDEPAAQTTG